MHSWYVLTYKRQGWLEGLRGQVGDHCGYTRESWPSRVHSKAQLRSMHNRSEQNCSKLCHTGCDINIWRSTIRGFKYLYSATYIYAVRRLKVNCVFQLLHNLLSYCMLLDMQSLQSSLFQWSTHFKHSASKGFGKLLKITYTFLVQVLIPCLIFSLALLMSTLSSRYSRAAHLIFQ